MNKECHTPKVLFECCLDTKGFSAKPDESIGTISNRIAGNVVGVTRSNFKEFVEKIGVEGHTFCPATFTNGERKKTDYRQMQLFALDFDGTISYETFTERAEHYDLPVLFAYETFTSIGRNRFRACFLNDVSITDIRVAEMIQEALMTIFPESDKQCRNVVQMYFGSNRKSLLYSDESLPAINVESAVRSMTGYLIDRYGNTNYKRKLNEFSIKTGIALNERGLLDVTITNDVIYDTYNVNSNYTTNSNINNDTIVLQELITETAGATMGINNNKFSPTSVIYIVIDSGENLSNQYYRIKFNTAGTNDSVKNTITMSSNSNGSIISNISNDIIVSNDNNKRNHKPYRKYIIDKIVHRCKLVDEFISGSRRLPHDELFGLATNITEIETGEEWFMGLLKTHSYYDSKPYKYAKWNNDMKLIRGYKPYSCSGFCPHKDICTHGTNIMSTLKIRNHEIVKLSNWHEKYYSIEESEEDVRSKIMEAINSTDDYVYAIKAPVAIGKTQIYLQIALTSDKQLLIIVPTNILKHEILRRAKKLGLKVMETPSLSEVLKDNANDIPDDVRKYVQHLYRTGDYKSVIPYIRNILLRQRVPPLERYLNELAAVEKFSGHIITTHRKFFTIDKKILEKYEIIIDEDPIYKSFIPNQVSVTISDLKKIRETTPDRGVALRIQQILETIESKQFFSLEPIKFKKKEYMGDENDDTTIECDISALCRTSRFGYLKASKQENIQEDCIVFFNRMGFFPNVKHIVLSATISEEIYGHIFGRDNIKFYECKKSKNTGRSIQYYNRTMSRSDIRANPEYIFKRLKETFGDLYIITFGEFEKYAFPKSYSGEKLHFGNTEGCDFLSNKDCCVLGTPHYPTFLYKLFWYSIGGSVDEHCELQHNQTVERNGYSFRFSTFADKSLRDVQMWLIETELIQAVGRSRLLRNNCTVHLFSNFILSQTELEQFDWDKCDTTIKA